MTTKYKSGRCRECGKQWVAVEKDEYRSSVARHIVDNHRDKPLDKIIVEEI